jgi:hypothetical protein
MKIRETIEISDLGGVLITAFVLLVSITTLVFASYTGPNRSYSWTTISYERKQCHYTGIKDYPGKGYCACSYTRYVSTNSGCPAINTGLFTAGACGWSGICATYGLTGTSSSSSIGSCSSSDTGATAVETQHNSSFPSATVSGLVGCTTAGENGWCVSPEKITISGSEPLSGYTITGIEGTQNGTNFTCTGVSSCDVSLVEGANAFTYWSDSSYGDTSLQGTTMVNQDTQKPQVTIAVGGTAGNNGWYTSGQVTGSADDPIPGSGIDSITYSLDGAASVTYSSPITLAAGIHTISMTATDKAGWTDTKSQTISVDLDDPIITSAVSGTTGSHSWFTTNVTLTGSAADPTPGSGLDTFTISDNGNPFTAFTGSTVFSDGQHGVTLRAEDIAGRVTTDEKTINVDTQKPTITKSITGTTGTNGWYIDATLNASSSDPTPGSGINTFEYSLDGSPWAAYNTPLVMTDGQHTVDLRTVDQAGWTDETSKDVKVDSVKPTLSVNITGTTSDNYTYTSDAVISASGADLTSELSLIEYTDNGGSWTTYTAPISFAIGEHTVILRSVDNAGNISDDDTLKFSVVKISPYIEMPSKWSLYESPNAIINAGYAVLAGAKVTISDPQNRYPAIVRDYSFSGSVYTISLAWDRKFANEKSAPIGTVNVNIDAWDVLGLHASASGVIEIKLDPTPTPTITPAPSATPVLTEGVPVTFGGVEIVPTATAFPQVVSTETTKPVKGKANKSAKALGFGILLGFVAMIGKMISFDPRPPVINRLANAVNTRNEDSKKK